VKVWGLTGNIACGKSAVETLLRRHGVPVIDADVVARTVVEPGQPALAEIDAAFPGVVVNGALDRGRLGSIVFGDADARKRLEAITHPRIFAEMGRQLAALADANEPVAVVSAALMVESGSWRNYAALAVVTCPPDAQLQRLMARDGSTAEQAQERIDSQMPQADKAALATVRLDNGGPPEALQGQVIAWIDRHLRSGGTGDPASVAGGLGPA